jgi:hypothetical protein
MHQYITIMISIANGTPNALLMCLVAPSGLRHVGTNTPIFIQQFLAKGHLKNKCLGVSYIAHKCMNQVPYSSLSA